MPRAARAAASMLLVLFFSAGPALALSPEAQTNLDALKAALAKAKPPAAAVLGNLQEDRSAPKDGVAPEALAADGNALAKAAREGVLVIKKFSKDDRADPDVARAVEHMREQLALVTQLGEAAPGVFFSPEARKAVGTAYSLNRAIEFREKGKLADAKVYLERASREFSNLKEEDRTCPDGMAFVAQVKALMDGLKDDESHRAERAAIEKAARQSCKDFDKQLITSKTLPLMGPLAMLQVSGHSGNSHATLNDGAVQDWLGRIAARKALFEQLKPVCDDAEKAKQLRLCVRAYSPDMAHAYATKDPKVWCEVAQKGNEVQIAELDEYVGIEGKGQGAHVGGGGLESGEGWLSDDLLDKTWATAFKVNDKAARAGRVSKLYAALGVKDADTSKLTAAREAGLAELKKEVERLAPTFDRPKAGVGHYGVELAKARVQSVFKGASVVASGGDSGKWNVHANILGVPEYRDRFGWVLFQVPGEPFCQLRTFYVSEDYSGGGTYNKDNSPAFGKLRFQKCK